MDDNDRRRSPSSAAAIPSDGPPTGFGLAVNQYLNHYVGVADAKAAGFVVAALTVGAGCVKVTPRDTVEWLLYGLATGLLGAAGIAGVVAISPRLPSPVERGVVFWEDIRGWPGTADYQRALAALTSHGLELEYAAQNYVVSEVLHHKHVCVRWSIRLFVAGTGAALLTYWRCR